MYRLILSWICQRWQIQLQNDDKSTCNQEMYAAQICLWIQRPLPCAADETLQHYCTLHPVTSFNASAFVRIPDCGTFDGRGCLVDRETRESLVLSPLRPPPPIFTIQQALKHDSCPFITTAHNSLKKMLWNPTRETVVRLGRIQQQLETFRAEANCRWERPRPNLLLGVLPYLQLRILLLPMCPYHHHNQRFMGRVSRTQGNTDCFEPVLFSFKRATYCGGHVPDNSGRSITSRRRTSQKK